MIKETEDPVQERTARISQDDREGKISHTSYAKGLEIKQSRLECSKGKPLRGRWNSQIAWCG